MNKLVSVSNVQPMSLFCSRIAFKIPQCIWLAKLLRLLLGMLISNISFDIVDPEVSFEELC